MFRPLILCLLGMAACEGYSSPQSLAPRLLDVSEDDCIDSQFVYDKPPAEASPANPGIAFINDGCYGDRIFLGINGERRELKRAENVQLGEGGAYSDGQYRVLVERGRLARRAVVYGPPDAFCHGEAEGEWEYDVTYEARVRIWSGTSAWTIDGALNRAECALPSP